ncbi:hypothetical protein JIR001_03930 [Polycladomyces abyssicola]|uniref:Uncharacterized protein n=1 Tax=Polycladomyces abyssicola TaxID=1125966 RepID=A0A8D5ZLG9_9BACL|nr:EYxxD motif small membrane protein [Polycladomyces abyssicola]BCU80610.1 hypothetical protein JIR001_03930 [Polycladomyces abyssicola]
MIPTQPWSWLIETLNDYGFVILTAVGSLVVIGLVIRRFWRRTYL